MSPRSGAIIRSRCGAARQELQGKTMLLHRRAGSGRYHPVHALRAAWSPTLGAKVMLGVQPPLKALATTVPGVVAWCWRRRRRCPISICIARCSACRSRSAPSLTTIPAKIPYLLAATRTGSPNGGRGCRTTAGCASESAGPAIRVHLNDRNRSMRLERFADAAVGAGPRLRQRAERSQRGAGGDP